MLKHILSFWGQNNTQWEAFLNRFYRTSKNPLQRDTIEPFFKQLFPQGHVLNVRPLFSQTSLENVLFIQEGSALYFLEFFNQYSFALGGFFCNMPYDLALKKMVQLDNKLLSHIDVWFDPSFGFVNTDINRLGTGLEITLLLHAPLLFHFTRLTPHDVDSFCIFNWLSNLPIACMTNRISIGINESLILSKVLEPFYYLKKKEQEMKNQLSFMQKDQITRSLGTLQSAQYLTEAETLLHLSLLKAATELGFIQGTFSFHSLFQATFSEGIESEEKNKTRAIQLNQLLKPLSISCPLA